MTTAYIVVVILLTINSINMAASVNYSIIGASAPFTFSVKDEDGIERFLNTESSKIWFTATKNGKYTVTVSKGTCHIKNEVIINNCVSSPTTPTTPVSSCVIPSLALTSVLDLTASFSITVSSNTSCTSYELQYSLNNSFSDFTSKFLSCVATANITFPIEEIYYVRLVKYCGQVKVYSNIVSANLNSTNCFSSASCLGIGNDPDYDTYRIALSKPASEDVQFSLSNGSTIIVKRGNTSAEEIVNISQNCPYIISNNLNLKYCGIANPVSPTTPVTPVTPVSSCTRIYAINNSNYPDIITFTLCNGQEDSYSLAPYGTSPEVCAINPNAWVSNLGQITIYTNGTC